MKFNILNFTPCMMPHHNMVWWLLFLGSIFLWRWFDPRYIPSLDSSIQFPSLVSMGGHVMTRMSIERTGTIDGLQEEEDRPAMTAAEHIFGI